MTTLSDIEQALKQAQIRSRDAEQSSRDFESKLKDEFYARLNRELQEGGFRDRVRKANTSEYEARLALQAEKERIALEETVHPYPLGTRMVEWGYPKYTYCGTPKDRRLTGRIGVLEVITEKSEHPANKTNGLAERGELVIRILKKDNTPSKSYERVNGWRSDHWVPEGADLRQEDLSWPKTDKTGKEEESPKDGDEQSTAIEIET